MAKHPILGALWRGAKAGYHSYRAGRLEERARAHRRLAVLNPRRTGIPGHVLEVRYARSGKDPGRYVHRFGPHVRFKLGPGRSRIQIYHHKGEPIWADERGADFDHWVDVDHRRRRMNPRLTRRKARLILHHGYIRRGGRKRRLSPRQRRLFGAVASGYRIRRYHLNPRRRRSSARREDWGQLLLLGFVVWAFASRSSTVSTGGQPIIPQGANTWWIEDPFQGGDGSYFQGSLPPGAAPPWRLASSAEQATLQTGLATGAIASAGGGLYVSTTGLLAF